jgi:hypothetical protein
MLTVSISCPVLPPEAAATLRRSKWYVSAISGLAQRSKQLTDFKAKNLTARGER